MNLNKIVEERSAEPQKQSSPEITQEQVTRAMSDILFQRMSQSEVELMRAENVQLKQTLADFTTNYNKFEDLIRSTIQQNNASVMRSISEQNSRLEQSVKEQNERLERKLNALQESNTMLSRNISTTVGSVSDKLTGIANDTSVKLSNSVSKATNSLEGSVDTLGKKITSFWSFSTFQTCLFWSAMLGLILLLVRPMCEVYELAAPVLVWKIAYPVALAPVVVFFIGTAIKTIIEKVRGY